MALEIPELNAGFNRNITYKWSFFSTRKAPPFPRTHGHAMVLRWKRTLALTEWQQQQCHKSGKSREECIKGWERENFCWEKFPFMVEP